MQTPEIDPTLIYLLFDTEVDLVLIRKALKSLSPSFAVTKFSTIEEVVLRLKHESRLPAVIIMDSFASQSGAQDIAPKLKAICQARFRSNTKATSPKIFILAYLPKDFTQEMDGVDVFLNRPTMYIELQEILATSLSEHAHMEKYLP